MKLATRGPAVRTTKPKSQGLRNAYAAQVSRSLNPDAQRRALRRGPGAAVLETVAKRGSGPWAAALLLRLLDRVGCGLLRLVQRAPDARLAREHAVDGVLPGVLELRARRRRRDVERVLLDVQHGLDRLIEVLVDRCVGLLEDRLVRDRVRRGETGVRTVLLLAHSGAVPGSRHPRVHGRH